MNKIKIASELIKLAEVLIKEQDDSVTSSKGWTRIDPSKDNIMIVRYSGKTAPCILYSIKHDKIYARDDNGKNPSKTYETSNISVSGVHSLLHAISKPLPTDEDIKWLIDEAEKAKSSKNASSETMDNKPKSEGVKVKVTGKVDMSGKTGTIVFSDRDGRFHVVEFPNGKQHSFQGSDLSPVSKKASTYSRKTKALPKEQAISLRRKILDIIGSNGFCQITKEDYDNEDSKRFLIIKTDSQYKDKIESALSGLN